MLLIDRKLTLDHVHLCGSQVGESAEVEVAKAKTKTAAKSKDKKGICAEADVKHGESGVTVIEMEEKDISIACEGDTPVSMVTRGQNQ